MTRTLLVVAVLASCTGNKQTAPVESLGSTHWERTATTKKADQKAADAALPFRTAFQDPGGMWLPSQMPLQAETFKKMGVELDAKQLANPLADPLAAIVALNGCTGSFVSPDGLIVTNHHCVQRGLQQNSSKDSNLVEAGFLAKARGDELPAGAAERVLVAQAFTDVTKAMRDGLEDVKDPIARKEESEKRSKTLIANCEKNRPGIRCSVSKLFGGGMYQLIENLEIRDVRLVYVPARSVGNYGGEIDNWNWPRHTGDWSFERAYVGKDGMPADQLTKDGKLADNVPYHPKHFLKIASQGLKPADFVMVTGYPGRTNRIATAASVHHEIEWSLPNSIEYAKLRYAILEAHAKDPNDTGIKATVAKQTSQNFLAKDEGILAGMTKGGLIADKDALDAKIKALVAKPGHEAQQAAIAKLEALEADAQHTAPTDRARGNTFGGSRLLSTALALVRWADERTKSDPERKPGFQERDLQRAVGAAKQFTKSYDRTLDRELFRLALVRAIAMPDAERPWLATLLDAKKGQKLDEAFVDKTLDAWYKTQLIEDDKFRLDLLTTGTSTQLKASKDPFVKAALRVWPTVKAEEKKEDARVGELLLVTPAYAEAMREVLSGFLSPDANGTLRVTYGTVRGLKPESKDEADRPFTVASGLAAKATGKEPFDAPQKVLDAIKAKTYGPYADAALGGELPIDFMSDVDITNGNSGSPTLNSRGELVGLAFDGTLAGIASDVVWNSASTRTIHVDVRYILWTMDLLDGADHLVKEMGVFPKLK